jgi:uncharacterized protein YkwD
MARRIFSGLLTSCCCREFSLLLPVTCWHRRILSFGWHSSLRSLLINSCRRSGACFLLLTLQLLAVQAGAAQGRCWLAAAKTVPPSFEQAVIAALHSVAGQTITVDPQLSCAAQALLPHAPQKEGAALPLGPLRDAAWQLGIVDAQLYAVALSVPLSGADPVQGLQHSVEGALKTFLDGVAFNRMGLAYYAADLADLQTGPPSQLPDDLKSADPAFLFAPAKKNAPPVGRLVVALSHHLVQLQPLDQPVARNAEIILRGQVLEKIAPAAAMKLTLALTFPGGTTRSAPLLHDHGRIEQRIAVGAKAGQLMVEVLLDRGAGPQIAALFPLQVGAKSSRAQRAVSGGASQVSTKTAEIAPSKEMFEAAAVSSAPRVTTGARAAPRHVVQSAAATRPALTPAAQAATLLRLLNSVRRTHGLAALRPEAQLTQVAQAHSQDMRQHALFAHCVADHGTVLARLQASGVQPLAVAENLAVAPSATAAMQQWMQSPAHLAALLHPAANALGVGVAPSWRNDAAQLYTLILARL